MTIEIHITQKEFNRIIKEVPARDDGSKSREDFADLICKEARIPMDLVHKIVLDYGIFYDDHVIVWPLSARNV